jgi:hypothetical protein
MLLKYIDKIPLLPLTVAAIFMSLAPFSPEPHLLEKSRMLINGELTKGIDIFDLLWHSFLIVLLAVRLIRYKKTA